jgi:hypothetical protein
MSREAVRRLSVGTLLRVALVLIIALLAIEVIEEAVWYGFTATIVGSVLVGVAATLLVLWLFGRLSV